MIIADNDIFSMLRRFLRAMGVLCVCTAFLCACSDTPQQLDGYEPDDTTVQEPAELEGSVVSLSIRLIQGSRAESHPDEGAVNQESAISNITVFIYDGLLGLNNDGATPILASAYLTKDQFTRTDDIIKVIFNVTGYDVKPADRMTAVANAGDLTGIKSIGELRETVLQKYWNEPSGRGVLRDFNGFVMAAADSDDGVLFTTSERDPNFEYPENAEVFGCNLSIERTAARLDLAYPASYLRTNGLTYPTKHGDQVILSHVVPVNVMQKPSYLIKHISKSADDLSDCRFAGTLPKENNRPTVYVVEPNTQAKAPELVTDSKLTEWYGNTASGKVTESFYQSTTALNTLLNDGKINIPVVQGTEKADRALILAYANENTHHILHHNTAITTGMSLRAVYLPAKVYSDAAASVADNSYTLGGDLWRFAPSNGDPDIFFTNEAAAQEFRDAGHPGRITYYPGAVCYYTLRLRHTVLSAPHDIFPMEYGIVRNHVYRVELTFSGIGAYDPDTPRDITFTSRIYVRPWSFKRLDQIIM